MADQKVILTSTNTSGQTLQKTLTDINPDASNAQLKTFAQMLNNMTDNTYGRTDRVIKYNCDTESGGSKLTPTFTLSKTSESWANMYTSGSQRVNYSIPFTYNGDGKIFANIDADPSCDSQLLGVSTSIPTRIAANPAFNVYGGNPDNFQYITSDVTITFRTEETDTYKSVEATFTITV